MNKNEIKLARMNIDSELHTYREKVMKDYMIEHHKRLNALEIECGRTGHELGYSVNAVAATWNYCKYCDARIAVEMYDQE
jgi:hypothetical protein